MRNPICIFLLAFFILYLEALLLVNILSQLETIYIIWRRYILDFQSSILRRRYNNEREIRSSTLGAFGGQVVMAVPGVRE